MPPSAADAAFVDAGEAFEDAFVLTGRNARTVVLDGDGHRAAGAVMRRPGPTIGRVATRCRARLPTALANSAVVAEHRQLRRSWWSRRATSSPPTVCPTRRRRRRGRRGRGVSAPRVSRAALRASSNRSSTSRWRPTTSSSTLSVRRGRVGAVGVGEVDLELRSHAGQRAAQLVRRVGDELSLPPTRFVDSFEHVVHRAGEPHDLVVACRAPGTRRWSSASADRRRPRRGSVRRVAACGRRGTRSSAASTAGGERHGDEQRT